MRQIVPPSAAAMPVTRPGSRRATAALWIIGLLLVLGFGAALKAMSSVMIPVVFAVLITLVFAPLHARLAALLPRRLEWLSLVAVMVALVAVVVAFIGALLFAAERVLEVMPDVSGDAELMLPSDAPIPLSGEIRQLWNSVSGSLGSWLVDVATTLAQSVAGATGVFFTTLVLVIFLVLLALGERGLWSRKIGALWPGEAAGKWSDALATLTARLQRFLVVRTFVGLLQAGLYVGWLSLFGVDLLIVWGLLCFLLTYIPNLGSIIAGILPTLYAFVTVDPVTALGVAAGLVVIEQVVGNFLDPRLLGRQIALSPFVILVALLFWSWLWGVAGAFLSTPLMLAMLVAFNHVPALRPLALIVSNQPDHEALDQSLGQA